MLRGSPLASGTLSRKPGHRVREPFHLDFKALLTTFLSVFMLFSSCVSFETTGVRGDVRSAQKSSRVASGGSEACPTAPCRSRARSTEAA